MLAEWNILTASFEAARCKVKKFTKEQFFNIYVISDNEVNYYLDQKNQFNE